MERLQKKICEWYLKNKRILPWRRDKDPYHIWISEVMLQQTRIEAVVHYYERFMKRLPTVFELSHVEEEELLKLWEGLGYYTRARNLKKAAEKIVMEYRGVFPTTFQEIIRLDGIGEYTASAISSICFNEKQATIDGNVLRVYTRFYNDYSNIDLLQTRKRIRQEIIKILPKNSGDFNEALMEIGETICIPNGIPLCSQCPLCQYCLAKEHETYLELPVKSPKKEKKEKKYTILILKYKDTVVIRKRVDVGILENLWEFPNVEGHLTLKGVKEYLLKNDIDYHKVTKFITTNHIFTHQKWNLHSYIVELNKTYPDSKKVEIIKERYAIPTVFQPFLCNLEQEKGGK